MRTLTRLAVGSILTVASLLPSLPAQAGPDSFADQLRRLRICESSNNYRAATGNGYFGAYQYAPPTWRHLGYAGRPDRASARTQDSATARLYNREGWRPWPGCAKREHLH